ncbi:MAG: hypothetical protein K8S99_06695 [Planctomycetes bacterium]|nr:hypothetical protein [Planctomycetota bacterium]
MEGRERDSAERELVGDILAARHDLIALAERHGMSVAELADWIGKTEHRRVIRGLCEIADAQAQVLLCRYRQMAVAQLAKLATQEGEAGVSAAALEVTRRACMDMLKIDLRRGDLPAGEGSGDAPDGASLRDMLYGRGAKPGGGEGGPA